jgi:hypothetical protein
MLIGWADDPRLDTWVNQSEARNKGCKCTRTFGDLVGDSVIRRLRPGQITTPRIQYKYLPPPSSFFPSPSTIDNNLHQPTSLSIKFSSDSIES